MAVSQAYLDYGAATPLAPEVLEAMLPYLTECFYNPSAPYAHAREARTALEDARASLAHHIGARPGQITLTAGATEANNLAFAATEGPVVCDAAEHESVLACAQAREHVLVGVDAQCRVSAADVAAALTPQTQLVSIELANGEVGTIQPVREVASVVAAERARRLEAGERVPLYLHTDASQAALVQAVNVSSLGADLVTLSAAKLYGPKQVGLLWSSDDVRLRPLVRGGGQEGGLRSGTENTPGILALAAAIEAFPADSIPRMADLKERLWLSLQAAVPAAVRNGPEPGSSANAPHILNVSLPPVRSATMLSALEGDGVYVSAGSACGSHKQKISPVLTAMGVPANLADCALRFSLCPDTDDAQIDYTVEMIRKHYTMLAPYTRR